MDPLHKPFMSLIVVEFFDSTNIEEKYYLASAIDTSSKKYFVSQGFVKTVDALKAFIKDSYPKYNPESYTYLGVLPDKKAIAYMAGEGTVVVIPNSIGLAPS